MVSLQSLAMDVESERNTSKSISLDFYRKQGKILGSALLCNFVGEQTADSLRNMLKLSVLVKKAMLFEKAAASIQGVAVNEFTPHIEPFVQTSTSMMAQRIDSILALVSKSPEVLTECLGLIIDDAPRTLTWKQVRIGNVEESGCFEAVQRRHMYSINVVNGTVLVNGAPPGLLPTSITANKQFLRTFGRRNFEVVTVGFGAYKTAKSVMEGVHYQFSIDEGDALQIVELNKSWNDELVLLPRDAVDLPVRLQEMYSHWMLKNRKVVVLRGPTYQARRVSYLMTSKRTVLVPFGFEDDHIDAIVKSANDFDALLMGSTNLSKILSRF
ncbi:MAG: hypothetical protein SGILL_004249 [Bacillariaceae sp.]